MSKFILTGRKWEGEVGPNLLCFSFQIHQSILLPPLEWSMWEAERTSSAHIKAFTLQNPASVVIIIYRLIYITAEIWFNQNYEEIPLERCGRGYVVVCVCVCVCVCARAQFQVRSYKRIASSSAINGYRMILKIENSILSIFYIYERK